MFFKSSGYKPRTNSQSSQNASGTQMSGSPPKEEAKMASSTSNTTQTASATTAAAAGRRRSSAAGGDKFAGLTGLKRNSQDSAKYLEQKPGQAGILGGMWNSFTKGS